MMKGISTFLFLVAIATSSFAGKDVNDHFPGDSNNSVQTVSNVIQPVVTEKYEYYEVCGICEKDLKCDLKQKCITWNDGKKYDSVTNWKVNWNYGHSSTSSACRADSFTVTVDIVFKLPKWSRTDDAPPRLAEKWDNFIRNLMIHERGHRDLAVAAAAELSRAVAELPPAQTCADLDKEVQALSSMKMKSLKEEQKKYDVTTNHGKKQGAVFP